MSPERKSISLWLEPEDLHDLDGFCQEKNVSGGAVLRAFLRGCDGLGFAQWIKARQKTETESFR